MVGLLALTLLGAPVALSRQGPSSEPDEPIAAAVAPSVALPEPPAPPTAPVPPTTVPAPPTATPQPTAAPTPTAIARVGPHTVEPGETVRILAERHGISIETLVGANDLANPNLLLVGQQLRIPTVDGVVYTPQPDETVRQVAERFRVSVGVVIEANGLGADADQVASGTTLVVPGATPVLRASAQRMLAQGAAPPAAPRRVSDAPPPPITARYVAILDEASGELLYGQDERARVAPASVTKIATTLVALERAPDLGRRIPVTISGSAMAARDGSSIMGLEPGGDVSLAALLYGMMLPSGNDAAEQVAVALGGSRETYVAWMNQKMADLGLQDTHFVNPSGMDKAGHYSSAYDMAQLGRFAMRDETFRRLAGAATYRGDGYSLANLNRLIGVYPGADGIKIGFTRAAGRTIVASASHNGHRVFISLMRSQDLPGDSTALFDWVWRTFGW